MFSTLYPPANSIETCSFDGRRTNNIAKRMSVNRLTECSEVCEDEMREAQISFPALGINVNPAASFSLFGLTIYYYGLIIASGLLLASVYCNHRSRDFGIKADDWQDLLIYAIPICVIGARLYYVAFNLDAYRGRGLSVLNLREGGMAIYGSVIAAIITVLVFCRAKKIPTGAMLDLGSLGMLIGQSVGRWGNFVNREAYGGETTTFLRMGLTLPGSEVFYVHPTFLYESLWNAFGFLFLHLYSARRKRKYDSEVFWLYIAWYGLGRMFIEGLRSDSLYIPGTSIRVSQVLAAVSMVAAVAILLRQRFSKHGDANLHTDTL